MSLKEELLTLLQQPEYVPLSLDEIADELALDSREYKNLKPLIQSLLAKGTIARVKRDRYLLPQDADLITGEIRFRQSGAAFLYPESAPNKPQQEPYKVLAEDTSVALHGDTVLARMVREPKYLKQKKNSRKWDESKEDKYARVIRILKRGRETITGTLERARTFYYVIPDDPRFIQDILVEDPKSSVLKPKPKVGDKIVVKLLEWKHRHLNPVGEIIKLLGKSHTPDAEFDALLHKYDLNPEFPDAVVRELNNIPKKVGSKDCQGRMDCRQLFTFNIDPDDAKDFDDALSVERLKDGKVRVGIHIADVSAYVKANTQLDREAQKRGNSTYLVGSVIPMLPHKLSSGLCSLIEGEDRLTKTVFLTFSAKGKLVDSSFKNTVIRSNKRLSYHQAYAFMTEKSLAKIAKLPLPAAHQTAYTGRALKDLSKQELQNLKDDIELLWTLGSRLRSERMQKGSLDLDMAEVKIYVDAQGYADRIEKIQYDESHQLIEEFMLAANEAVSKALHKANFPFISRVHDAPDPDKLDELREQMLLFGVRIGDLNNRPEMARVLKKIKGHPQEHALKVQVLRSLKQACYRAQSDGHYGLCKQFYAHFTSPIRRYADLILHRVFDAYLVKQGLDTAPKTPNTRYSQGDLDSLSQHLSLTERNSVDAEREHTKIKLIEFFEREKEAPVKRPFKAIITEVRNHGMFVELVESMAFGLVHISTLKDDLYSLNRDGTAIVGRRRNKEYWLGQEIEVQVERVDRFKRQIDFAIYSNKESAIDYPKTSSKTKKTLQKKKFFKRKKSVKPKRKK